MSSKNELQEYCQKNRYPLPVYNTSILNEKFVCSVFVSFIRDPFVSEGYTSKREAEKDAASKVMEYINSTFSSVTTPRVVKKRGGAIFIDAENKQNETIDLIKNYDTDGVEIYVFYTKDHPVGIKFERAKIFDYPNVHSITTSSHHRDSADNLLIMHIGQLRTRYSLYIILTNDHFADSVVDIINENYDAPRAYVARTTERILEILKNF